MDLQALLKQLRESGLSDYKIAEAVGTSQPTIHRLRTGSQRETTFTVGRKIADLAKDDAAMTAAISRGKRKPKSPPAIG